MQVCAWVARKSLRLIDRIAEEPAESGAKREVRSVSKDGAELPKKDTFDPYLGADGVALEPRPFIPAILDDAKLMPSDFRVLGCFWARAASNGLVQTNLTDVASFCGLNRDTVSDAVKRLIASNWISSSKALGSRRGYKLNVPNGPLRPFFPRWLEAHQLDPTAYRVYCHLTRRVGKNPTAYPSAENIQRVCRIGEDSRKQALATLTTRGLVEIGPQQHRQPTQYRILVPAKTSSFASVPNCPTQQSEFPSHAESTGVKPAENRGAKVIRGKEMERKQGRDKSHSSLPATLSPETTLAIATTHQMTSSGVAETWAKWRGIKLCFPRDIEGRTRDEVLDMFSTELVTTKRGRLWRHENRARPPRPETGNCVPAIERAAGDKPRPEPSGWQSRAHQRYPNFAASIIALGWSRLQEGMQDQLTER